jgi:hypothetical protein
MPSHPQSGRAAAPLTPVGSGLFGGQGRNLRVEPHLSLGAAWPLILADCSTQLHRVPFELNSFEGVAGHIGYGHLCSSPSSYCQ